MQVGHPFSWTPTELQILRQSIAIHLLSFEHDVPNIQKTISLDMTRGTDEVDLTSSASHSIAMACLGRGSWAGCGAVLCRRAVPRRVFRIGQGDASAVSASSQLMCVFKACAGSSLRFRQFPVSHQDDRVQIRLVRPGGRFWHRPFETERRLSQKAACFDDSKNARESSFPCASFDQAKSAICGHERAGTRH